MSNDVSEFFGGQRFEEIFEPVPQEFRETIQDRGNNSPVFEESGATQGMDNTTYWDTFEIACKDDDCDGRCYPLRPETDPEHNRVRCFECRQVYQIELEVEQ